MFDATTPHYRLNPLWWLVMLLIILLGLGFWQIWRAQSTTNLERSKNLAAQAPVQNLTAATALDTLHEFQFVQLDGVWMPEHTIFIDNRSQTIGQTNHSGFWVLTPLRLGDHSVVMILRGWVARNFLDRNQLPAITSTGTQQHIFGQVLRQVPRSFALKSDDPQAQIMQNFDLTQVAQARNLALLPLIVRDTSPSDAQLLRDWPKVNTQINKHYAYALQWFTLALLLLIFMLWKFYQSHIQYHLKPHEKT